MPRDVSHVSYHTWYITRVLSHVSYPTCVLLAVSAEWPRYLEAFHQLLSVPRCRRVMMTGWGLGYPHST